MRHFDRLMLPGLFIAALTFASNPAFAAAGSLDPTFGNGGVVVTTLTAAGAENAVIVYSLKLQADGRILVLADIESTNFLTTNVLRYTTSGQLDTTFGNSGIAALPTTLSPDSFLSMTLQPNGQILVGGAASAGAGLPEFTVQRLNTNGAIDTTFGQNGLARVGLNGRGILGELVVLVETSGGILECGQLAATGRGQPSQIMLVRFTSGGALDKTFGNQGTTIATEPFGCTAVAELSTGEIQVVNGQAIAQFTANGIPEPTVTGGTPVASAGSELSFMPSTFQRNGDYLLGQAVFTGVEADHNSAVQLLRFTSTGSPDSSFSNPMFHFIGNGGSEIEAIPNALAVQSNGDIVVAGDQVMFSQSGMTIVNGLARLTSTGVLDPTFGSGGTVANTIPSGTKGFWGVVIQPADGKIVTVGTANQSTQVTVSRYLGQ